MSDTVIAAAIVVVGTLGGVFITSLFNLLTKKTEHRIFIKRLRAERTFDFCAQLVSHILSAEYVDYVDYNGGKAPIYYRLTQPASFLNWYAEFVDMYRSREHLLNPRTLEACKNLSGFLYALVDSHKELIRESSLKPLTLERLVQVSAQLQPVIFEVHASLQEFLKHGIEDV